MNERPWLPATSPAPMPQPKGAAPPETLPQRPKQAHKGNFGRVLVVGGSRGMSGAVAMASSAALKSGAGLVTAAVPEPCLDTVANFHPACMSLPLPADRHGHLGWKAWEMLPHRLGIYDALAIGPGMGQHPGAQRIVRRVLHSDIPRVFDADALNLLAQETDWPTKLRGPTILTPHPGEWQRLTGIAAKHRDEQCQAAVTIAAKCGAVIVVKGAETFVTDGSQTYRNLTGNPGMASGGSGDCLTGLIGGLVAQNLSPWTAAILGVWAHGRAGDFAAHQFGEPGMTAVELLHFLPNAVSELTSSR